MSRQLVIRSIERVEYINIMELNAEYVEKFNEYLQKSFRPVEEGASIPFFTEEDLVNIWENNGRLNDINEIRANRGIAPLVDVQVEDIHFTSATPTFNLIPEIRNFLEEDVWCAFREEIDGEVTDCEFEVEEEEEPWQ